MSGEHITENLLLQIAYSKRGAIFLTYKNKLVVDYDRIFACSGSFLSEDTFAQKVIPPIKALTDEKKCGITVDLAKDSESDTVIRVYALPAQMKCHRFYSDRSLANGDACLCEFICSLSPMSVHSTLEASGEPDLQAWTKEWIDHWWARWDFGDLKAKLDDLKAKVYELDDEKVSVPLGWKIVTSENVDTLTNGGTMSFASADGVYDKLDHEYDEDDFDWKTHQDQMARLELRRLRAEMIKAEIEAAEAIRDSEFYGSARFDIEKAAAEVREYLEGWG